jgi:hypothetical protein
MILGAAVRSVALRGEKRAAARTRARIFRTGPVAHARSVVGTERAGAA